MENTVQETTMRPAAAPETDGRRFSLVRRVRQRIGTGLDERSAGPVAAAALFFLFEFVLLFLVVHLILLVVKSPPPTRARSRPS